MARQSHPRPATLDIDNIITDYYETPHANHNSPHRRVSSGGARVHHESIPLPPFARPLSNTSTYTVSSTTDLVPGHGQSSKFNERSYSWPWSQDGQDSEPFDKEKMAVGGERNGDAQQQTMKPWNGWKVVVLGSWMNLLLPLLPASWIVDSVMEEAQTLVFVFCILAMMPLVRLHDLATRELAIRIGGSKTGLLNASMSNVVEMVIATTALRKCQLRVVQSSLIGSMLSKLLLVLGMCFFAGGLRFTEQDFDTTTTQIHSSLLSISVGAVLLPAAYHFALSGGEGLASNEQKKDILKMSHGVSIILLLIYVSYLLFQLYSHTHLFKDRKPSSNRHALKPLKSRNLHIGIPSTSSLRLDRDRVSSVAYQPTDADSRESSPGRPLPSPSNSHFLQRRSSSISPYDSASASNSVSDFSLPVTNGSGSASSSTAVGFVCAKGKALPAPALGSTVKLVQEGRYGTAGPATELPGTTDSGTALSDPGIGHINVHFDEQVNLNVMEPGEEEKEEPETKMKQPSLSWPMTLALLVVVTVLVAINAEWLVESMDGLSSAVISMEWIGLILLPAISSIAECVTTANVSRKDQLTLSISVAVGSTIQTALFVVPFMIILGWILGKPLPLLFDPFESVVLYISVHTMGYVVADGKSNWLEGAILIFLYVIIAVCFWFYPGSTFSSTLAVCASDPTA